MTMVEWAIYGPIDMFPFFGSRSGKAAVLGVIRQIARQRPRPPLRPRADHARGGFGGLDDALFADRA